MVKTEFVEINLDAEFNTCVNGDEDIDNKSARFSHHRHKSEGDIKPRHKLDDFIYPDFKFDRNFCRHFKSYSNDYTQKIGSNGRFQFDIRGIDDAYHETRINAYSHQNSSNSDDSPYHYNRYFHSNSESNNYRRSLSDDQDNSFDFGDIKNYLHNTSTEDNSNSSQRSLSIKERKPLDILLHEIYRLAESRRQSSVCESDTLSEGSPHHYLRGGYISPNRKRTPHWKYRKQLLLKKDISELRLMRVSLKMSMTSLSSVLVKEVKKKDRFLHKFHRNCDVITAILHALSSKTREDTRMRFSVEPFAGDSGFTQWHDAMKMCARLPGGIPPEFRRRMWLTLAEQHVRRRGISWKEAERTCFNEWASPDDEGLGDQIIKDLHRTGCSLFCGADAEGNQALLKRVLLGYARWNKNVGYCQGFNMLAAIILEVMDRQESDALKVMIYLIEGVLPESYFANNLRGLSVDMAVFRELMRVHLPELSRHLEQLQHEAADQATGACYEPPLTNVFTMQWFLTLFSNCLPRDAVMRVWDLTFLQGNEMLLRTALAIWGRLSSRILEVPTADEFYCVMGDLTRKMLTHGLMDTNQLVQTLIAMAPFPFPGLAMLRDKYTYNITPWAQSVSSVARKGFKIFLDEDEEDEKTDHEDVNQKVAIATVFGLGGIFRKSSDPKPLQGENIPVVQPHQPADVPNMAAQPLSGMARPNLDISALKKQYSRLRERQKQAHIILTASNIRRRSIDEVNRLPSLQKTNQLTMKHLLRGKKALTTKTKRVVAQGVIPPIITKTKVTRKLSDSTGMKKQNSGLDRATKGSLKPNLSKAVEPPVVQSTLTNEVVKPKKEETLSPPSPAAEVQDDLEDEGESPLPSETLHWKDTPRRARRASLPHGVKLMESLSAPLPDIKDDDIGEEEFEDDNSSTSTELCDEDLAVLSEEEPPSVIPRALSTSPRLENHDLSRKENDNDKCLSNKTVIPELITVDLSESSEVKESEGERSEGASLSQQQNNDINLISDNSLHEDLCIPLTSNSIESAPDIIPTFITPPSLQKASLSSPTKWKWSFSEIENPDLIEPVSPILKLHNFLSEESVEEEEDNSSLTFLPPSPKIVINNESTLPEESTIQYDPSSIFAYLFEITDVSKLSNVNSEEPSPVEEIPSKSDTENLFDDKEWINSNIVRDRFSSFITLEDTVEAPGLVENDENKRPDYFPTQKNKWKTDSEDAKDDDLKNDDDDDDLKYEDEKEEAGEKSTILKNEFYNIKTDTEAEGKAAREIYKSEKESSVDISSDLLQKNCKINEQNSDLDDLDKREYVASDVFISEIKRKVSNDTECQLEGPVEDISPKTENEIKTEANKPSVKNEIISDSKSVKENLKLKLIKSIEDNSSVLANETESRKSEEIATVTRNDSDVKALTITSENTNFNKNLTLSLDLESISDKELHTLRAQNEISKEHEKDYLTHENNAHDLKELKSPSHKDDLESNFSLNVSSHEKDKKEKEILSKKSLTIDVESSDIPLNQSNQESKNNDTERDTTLLKGILKPDDSQKDSDFISRFSSTDYKSCIESHSDSLPFTFNSDISKASLIENEETTKDESLSSTTKFNAIISNKTEPVSINVSQDKVSANQTNDKESSNEKVNPEKDFKSILHYKRSTAPSVKYLTEEKNKDTASSEHLSNIETEHTQTENDKVRDNIINSVVLNSNKSKVSAKRKIESKDTVTSSASSEGILPYEIVELATESQTSSLKDVHDDNIKNVDLRKYYFSSVFKSVSLESETNEMKDEETDDDSSDMSDPAKDLTDEATEVIRRKLWAGVKSLSLDADLLIATNKAQKCYLDFSSSLPTVDESPSNETNSDSGKDIKSEIEVSTLVTHRKGPTRRKSEAALKLMKENTKIIDQILNQRYGEENDNIFLIKKEELEDFKDRKASLCFSKSESLSDHNISESFNETESETTNNKNCKTFQRSASHESLENLKIICLDRNNSSISSFFLLDDDKSKDNEKKSSNSKINITECITQKTTNVSTYFNTGKEEKEYKSLDLENELNTKENNLKNDIETTPKHTTKVSPPIVPFCKLSKLSPKTKSSSRTLLNGSSKSFDISSTIKTETISRTSTSSCQTSPEEPSKPAQVKLKLRESLSDVIPDHIQVKQQPRTPCNFKTGLQEFQGSVQDVRLPEGIQPKECDQIIPQSGNIIPTPPTESIQNKNATKQHFNPFPTTKPLHRSPKDAALKVGLYNSNKSLSDSS